MERFIGTWKNKSGNILEIKPYDKNSLLVTFISGKTNKPVIRQFCQNQESVDMVAELDYYETSLEVELWKKGKGFQFSLFHDWIDFRNELSGYRLAPGIVRYIEDNFTKKYDYLFEPLEYYERIIEDKKSR
jgi:hypothetical protein